MSIFRTFKRMNVNIVPQRNLYFETISVNSLIKHLTLHYCCIFLHQILDFGNPRYQTCKILRQVHHLEPLLIVWHSYCSLSSDIYSVFFYKIDMNTNKTTSSWSLLPGLKIPLIVMSVKKLIYQESWPEPSILWFFVSI